MPAEPVPFLVALFGATLTWAGGLTKMGLSNRSRIDVLETKQASLADDITEVKDTLIRQEGKLDKIVEHLLKSEE